MLTCLQRWSAAYSHESNFTERCSWTEPATCVWQTKAESIKYFVKYRVNEFLLRSSISFHCLSYDTEQLHQYRGYDMEEYINSLRPRRNRRHFADDIFQCIFLNENEWISLRISLKFVPKVRINNIPSLVQVMTWRRPCDKPLSEPMMVRLPTHICVTRPQWVNTPNVKQLDAIIHPCLYY